MCSSDLATTARISLGMSRITEQWAAGLEGLQWVAKGTYQLVPDGETLGTPHQQRLREKLLASAQPNGSTPPLPFPTAEVAIDLAPLLAATVRDDEVFEIITRFSDGSLLLRSSGGVLAMAHLETREKDDSGNR